MKTIKLACVIGLISLVAHGQKVIEKNLEYRNQTVNIDLKFASDIEVRSWDKNEVYFKADITVKDEKYLALYELHVDENNSRIEITEDATPIFKAFQEEYKASHKGNNQYCCDIDYTFNYVLYLPQDAVCKVSSINGDLHSDMIDGNFTTDLINGDIAIKEYSGDLELRTINGAIDLTLKRARITAETIHGNIYADEKFAFTSENRMVGQRIEGATDNAENHLQLNTINGNMYLRL